MRRIQNLATNSRKDDVIATITNDGISVTSTAEALEDCSLWLEGPWFISFTLQNETEFISNERKSWYSRNLPEEISTSVFTREPNRHFDHKRWRLIIICGQFLFRLWEAEGSVDKETSGESS